MNHKIDTTIIIPVINEEKNIRQIFDFINKNIPIDISYEIIFVDDKSIDKTVNEIEALIDETKKIKLIHSKEKKGLGWAYMQAVEQANSKYLMFIDADLSIDKDSFSKILNMRRENLHIIGSRYLKNSRINYPSNIKVLLSKNLNKVISLIFKLNLTDAGHSFRIFPKINLNEIKIYTHPGFFWNLCIISKNKKMIFKEIPVIFNDRVHGQTKNSYLKLSKSIIKFFYLYLRNKI